MQGYSPSTLPRFGTRAWVRPTFAGSASTGGELVVHKPRFVVLRRQVAAVVLEQTRGELRAVFQPAGPMQSDQHFEGCFISPGSPAIAGAIHPYAVCRGNWPVDS